MNHALGIRILALLALASCPWPLAHAESPWDLEALCVAPNYVEAAGFNEPGVKAIFYDGLPWQGRATKVFAWYGLPNPQPAEPVPTMVLVHGGGGTAFAEWVRLWTGRGYAAIAMDTCGAVPRGEYGKWERHENGGPPGWGAFETADQPEAEQWPFHAVADVILAHSLIRSLPGVDANRTGLTGISWGGYLTCIVAGVDNRFKLAAPVYGCGFLGENSAWLDAFAALPEEKSERWLSLWDPSVHLPRAAMPMLWVTGTNDFAYPMDSLQKSYRLPSGPRTLAIRLRMPHGHGGAGENPEEIHAFANHLLFSGAALPKVTAQGREGQRVWLEFHDESNVSKAELLYTLDSGKWQDRLWEAMPAELDLSTRRASAELPDGCTVFYINIANEAGYVVSGEHEVLTP